LGGGGTEAFFETVLTELLEKYQREQQAIAAGTFHLAGGSVNYLVSGRKNRCQWPTILDAPIQSSRADFGVPLSPPVHRHGRRPARTKLGLRAQMSATGHYHRLEFRVYAARATIHAQAA